MKKLLNLLVIFFLAAGTAPAAAQPSPVLLEGIGPEMAGAASADSPEDARRLSARALDGLSSSAPEIRLGGSSGGGGVTGATPAAVRRVDVAAKVPGLAHMPPVSESKRPGALRILLKTPLSLITVPVTGAFAGYYAGSSGSYIEHRHTAAKVFGALGAAIGFVIGIVLIPVVMLVCLGKAVRAMCSGRW